jgi:predicted membrane-bound mannosyltransferase
MNRLQYAIDVVVECAIVVTWRGVNGGVIIRMSSLDSRGYWAFNGYIIPCTVPAGTWHIAAWSRQDL